MKIAINKEIDFKPRSDDRASFHLLATSFQNYDLTIEEIAHCIRLGYPFCPQHEGRRNKANFIACSAIAVDIDWGMPLQDVLNHPFVKKYAGIVYLTWSSTAEHNRSRVIFFCIDPITDASTMEQALTGGIRLLGGDGACKDACRMFYGNKNSEPIVLGNVLSNDALNELIALGTEKEPSVEKMDAACKISSPFSAQSRDELEEHQLVQTASGALEKFEELKKGDRLHCPFHKDENPSAFVTESHSGIKGVHCSTCAKTFWPKHEHPKSREYDFNLIDSDLAYIEFQESSDYQYYEEKHKEFFSNDGRIIQPRSGNRLGKIKLENGFLLVRSPMGTGKTYELTSIFHECEQKGLSVLLIGHRRTLISSLAKRIGLACYLDEAGNKVAPTLHYAICVDSIPRLIDLRANHYDVIIIDESEQVFSHFTSDTLGSNRRKSFLMMQRLIKKAATVIACDADLSYLTLCSLALARDGEMPAKFFINRHQHPNRTMEIYQNENHLLIDLIKEIKKGGKVYVCSNSKEKVEEFKRVISNAIGPGCKIKVVTSDTTKNSDTKKFIGNIAEEILHYDVTISSPSLGTGIDISFPDDAQMIDGVYGFFDAKITTHFDIAQQLGRVRNPKRVRAWISPQRFSLEIEPDIIKRTIVENGEFSDIHIHYDDDDFMIFDIHDGLLSLFAEVRSIQNASKNELRANFISHKSYNGCVIKEIDKDAEAAEHGGELRRIAKGDIKKSRSKDIVEADKINHSEAKRIENFNSNDPLERAKLEKFSIEKFYGEPVTQKLIALDDSGRYRPKMKLFSDYIEHVKNLSMANEDNIAPDYEKLMLLFKLLKVANIVDNFGNFIAGKLIETDDLTEFKKTCVHEKLRIKTLLGILLRNDIDLKPMTQLGDILKKMGLVWNKPIKKDLNKRRVAYYSVDFSHYQWAARVSDNLIKNNQSWGKGFITSSEVDSDIQ
ncbi:plasmid replication protein, CyRepA1 family [Massilia sp. CMS3.1]|uniref:plasmid replication protein, CyRepA1 family n=1 Tax=Massilia sp. CMS3.1 TaxID=3373083 RepID=UPI003EE6FDBC